MIIDSTRPHRRQHERPPREPSDRGAQQQPPSEPQIGLNGAGGSLNFATGVHEQPRIVSSSGERHTRQHVMPDATQRAQSGRRRRDRARRLAQLALTQEAADRQTLTIIIAQRWRRRRDQDASMSSTPSDPWRTAWALDLAQRLERRAQRHEGTDTADAARTLGARVLMIA